MNTSDPTPSPAAEDQAALWAAKLDGASLSHTDRKALDAWLAEKPEHRSLLSDYCQFSADLEERLPVLVASGKLKLAAAPHSARRTPRLRASWAIAGALAAAAAVAIGLWPMQTPLELENIATPIGARRTLELADGTRLELNARTQLVVETGPEARRVRLAAGEAFFSVAKDPQRPFLVETPAGSVRVTGTQFNVRSPGPSILEVTVVEGSVQVRPGEGQTPADAAPVSLEAGGRFAADGSAASLLRLSESELENVLAWRQGQVVFNNTPLGSALERFAHHHGCGINATAEAAALRIGGRYSLDDLEGFFAALEEVLPVRIHRDLSGTVRVSARAQD